MKNQNIRAIIISERCALMAQTFLKDIQQKDVKIFYSFQEIDLPAFHCVVFADTPEEIEKAKTLKIRTVAVANAQLEKSADWFITNFEDIDIDYFLESGCTKRMPVCESAIIEEDFRYSDVNHLESLFALGNGYLGLRGTYDETDSDIHEVCGMYLNGIFATSPHSYYITFPGFSKQTEYTVNLADWRIFNLYIDGEKACFSKNNITNHKRVLDMQNGNLKRNFIFETATGKRAAVESIRIVNMDEVHGAEISYCITPMNFDGEIMVEMQVVKNTEIRNRFPCEVLCEKTDGATYILTQGVKTTGQKVVTAIRHTVQAKEYQIDIENTEHTYSYKAVIQVSEGEPVTVQKYAAYSSSMDEIENMEECAEHLALQNEKIGFEELQKRQEMFWKCYWEKGDVQIKGNPADAQAVKFSLFQLRQQLSTVNACSIGATGLTGPQYSGRVYWDTEMYLMPYYNFTYPETQKQLLMYRYRILDKARERAHEFGTCGAMYAWCSIDGEETSTLYEASTAEYHLNSDIAYAVWRYVDTTQDKEFLYRYGAEIVFETAKFMFRRGFFSEENDGKFCMNIVCGPDEYGCAVNNNCYTNLMLQFHLNYAVSVANEMKHNAPESYKELLQRIDLDEKEFALWKKAADNMYYKYNEKLGIYEQDDSFVRKEPVDMTKIPINSDIRWMYHPLDLWRKQVSKQADLVLINFIRGNVFTTEEKLRNYEYYEPRCNHGSSLSPAIHAVIACELGKPETYDFFRCSAYMDIGDFKRNTNGGVHIACLGGVWMIVVNGYLGMRHYEDGIHFNPAIPSAWDEYSCNITYRSASMKITVSKEGTVFELTEGDSLSFYLGEKQVTLTKESKCHLCNTRCMA